jgi:hypothetical protein
MKDDVGYSFSMENDFYVILKKNYLKRSYLEEVSSALNIQTLGNKKNTKNTY